MGKQVYLTDKEIRALYDVASEWCSIMGDGEETQQCVDEKMEDGLGSALSKLTSMDIYKEYKS